MRNTRHAALGRARVGIALIGTLLVFASCSVGGSDGGSDADAGVADSGAASADWLAGWKLLGEDALAVGNLTSVWSNAKPGAAREWLIAGGDLAGDKAGVIWELRGDKWRKHSFPGVGLLWWVHGDSDGRRIAVGDGGVVIRWQSGDEKLSESIVPGLRKAGTQLFGVWFTQNSKQFWIVGGNASGQNATGLLWSVPFEAVDGAAIAAKATKHDLGDDQGLVMKVWGVGVAGNEHLFAVGEEGRIWSNGGGKWAIDADLDVDRWIGVTGSSATDVVAVGGLGSGAVARRDKDGWSKVAGCATCFINGSLAAVLLTDDGTVVVGGSHGFLATQKGDTSNKDLPTVDPPLSELDLHGAWRDKHTAVVVGGNLNNPTVAAGVVLYRGAALPTFPK